jgi:thiamine biosynthesis lipoprotein
MKKIISLLLAVIMVVITSSGCQKQTKVEYTKYSDTFFDAFDTIIVVMGYTKTEEEFKSYFQKIQSRYLELHKLYDIYNDYDGINNIKTINDNAGIKPVKVEKEIIDLLLFSKEWHTRTGGIKNIALGPVLRIWHDYREEGKMDPDIATLPPMDKLKEASKYTDINKVIVDVDNSTVFLEDKQMSLDVGAIAKGYATELVAKEMMKAGFNSGIINAGGNIRVIGKPLDGIRERWGIGLQDPNKPIASDEDTFDTVFVSDASVVSSGDYQRYYVVNGKVYHHLIDPKTLMPGEYYRAVTIITEHSDIADALSAAVFLMPYEESRKFVESLEGVEVVWFMQDGKVEATDGAKKIMKSNGATGAKAE